jgi:tellurite resistance protein TerC
MHAPWYLWVGFNLLVLVLLALDLGVFHRKAHAVGFGEAIGWTVFWILLALTFNGVVWQFAGAEKGLEFLTGYLIEKSLSMDNIFVFAVLFSYFGVQREVQHKVLFWGILGALIMRAAMIGAGVALIESFEWVIYIFGGFLIYTGVKMGFGAQEEVHPEKNPVVKLARKLIPVAKDYHGSRFWMREKGKRMATPLFVVLLAVECTDVVFAVDSIPAIFAVTRDPFIVYTSNVFAILGLRALYFALAGLMPHFRFLKSGLGLVLGFVGAKMLLSHTQWHIPTHVSLFVIAGILTATIGLSLAIPEKKEPVG